MVQIIICRNDLVNNKKEFLEQIYQQVRHLADMALKDEIYCENDKLRIIIGVQHIEREIRYV